MIGAQKTTTNTQNNKSITNKIPNKNAISSIKHELSKLIKNESTIEQKNIGKINLDETTEKAPLKDIISTPSPNLNNKQLPEKTFKVPKFNIDVNLSDDSNEKTNEKSGEKDNLTSSKLDNENEKIQKQIVQCENLIEELAILKDALGEKLDDCKNKVEIFAKEVFKKEALIDKYPELKDTINKYDNALIKYDKVRKKYIKANRKITELESELKKYKDNLDTTKKDELNKYFKTTQQNIKSTKNSLKSAIKEIDTIKPIDKNQIEKLKKAVKDFIDKTEPVNITDGIESIPHV